MDEDNKALALRMYELFEGDDIDAFDELIADDIVDHNLFPGQPEGREGATFIMRMLKSGFPDFHQEVREVIAEGDRVAVHSTMTGTHQGPFARLPPTGRPIEVPLVGIFDFEGDRLMCERVYFDMATLMRQLQP